MQLAEPVAGEAFHAIGHSGRRAPLAHRVAILIQTHGPPAEPPPVGRQAGG